VNLADRIGEDTASPPEDIIELAFERIGILRNLVAAG
jgi:hypothetical protein